MWATKFIPQPHTCEKSQNYYQSHLLPSFKTSTIRTARENYISLIRSESDTKTWHKINHNQRPLHFLTASRTLFCPGGFREHAAALNIACPAPLISLHSYRASLHKGTSDASRLTNTKSEHFSILIFPLKLYTYHPVNPQSTFINFNFSPSPLLLPVEVVRLSEVIYQE